MSRAGGAGPSLRWSIQTPPPGEAVPDWLEEIRAFRGRVLHDRGRRPGFQTPSGRFHDPDPADLQSFHVMAEAEGGIVGCVRLGMLDQLSRGVCERLLGPAGLADVLSRAGLRRSVVAECGGWSVAPEHRRTSVAFTLSAYACALAQHLGVSAVFSAAGTRDGQARALARIAGYRWLPEVGDIPVPHLDDEVRIGLANPSRDGSRQLRELSRQLLARHVRPLLDREAVQ